MYLSRVEIDTGNRTVLRTLNHLGAYHNWVEQAFPDEVREETRSRKLWRIDQIEGKRYLLVASETEPDCEQMETYAVKGSFGCKDYEPFLQSVKQGECFRFRVTLNPVHSVFEENNSRGKIYPIYAEAAQRKFFLDRTEKHGFHVESGQFLIVERGEATLLRKGKRRVDLVKAVYEGALTVENPELFVDLLCHGMGREKAYGFGMMTVIRG
ncbi:MAG: type I-E CRISPR-associated protein Cas6/Cse3/CasE [Lachnospiraceae bacterium]|nr:type I-E CRISPR-associated protein Cas6/Cse3/CasE [Lachnospiraceae bacterium]